MAIGQKRHTSMIFLENFSNLIFFEINGNKIACKYNTKIKAAHSSRAPLSTGHSYIAMDSVAKMSFFKSCIKKGFLSLFLVDVILTIFVKNV